VKTVLVTGATGFVAQELIPLLRTRGWLVRAATREGAVAEADESVVVGDIRRAVWTDAVRGVDAVVHLAARVHVLHDSLGEAAALTTYRETNELATQRLAEAALQAGVGHFVFLSTIKVNGEHTDGAPPLTEQSTPDPRDAYARSKYEAERILEGFSGSHLRITRIRPPLVFGPGVRANFLRMLRWVDRELPLPLAAIENRRSLISIWNLADLLATVLDSDTAPPLLLAAEEPAISTPELLQMIAAAMSRRARLFKMPATTLSAVAKLFSRQQEFQRLASSLVVDASLARRALEWHPPVSLQEGLQRTAAWYLSRGGVR
jgi:nucleoside-diphosphate-sugar epimerase